MKQIINAIAKHPVIWCFSSIIVLIFCLGIIQKLHPLLIIFVFCLPLVFLLAPSIAKKTDPIAIKSVSDNTIKVSERKAANRRVLSLIRHIESYSKYNPASATFSAATVGGVTTGGWSVKEAHYSAEMGAKTDKYLLCYTPNVYYKDRCSFPSQVILTNSDMQAARNQGFCKYLKGNTLVLRNTGKWKNAEYARNVYASTGDFYGASNYLVKDYTASLLTQPEMQKILDFLCGDENVRGPGETHNSESSYKLSFKYRCKACNSCFTGYHKECPSCHTIGKMVTIKSGSEGVGDQNVVSLKKYMCEACGRHYKKLHDECPNCHAVGKIKKIDE